MFFFGHIDSFLYNQKEFLKKETGFVGHIYKAYVQSHIGPSRGPRV